MLQRCIGAAGGAVLWARRMSYNGAARRRHPLFLHARLRNTARPSAREWKSCHLQSLWVKIDFATNNDLFCSLLQG